MKSIFPLFALVVLLSSCTSLKKTEEAGANLSEISSENADFTIAFGSCNRQDLLQPLWVPIIANRPDVFIWGGDNIYADTEDMKKLERDYQIQKENEGYQKLLSSTNILATWNDHDYGLNTAEAVGSIKRKVSRNFWISWRSLQMMNEGTGKASTTAKHLLQKEEVLRSSFLIQDIFDQT